MRFLLNPAVRRDAAYRGLFEPEEHARVHQFYRAGSRPVATPLVSLRGLAEERGLRDLLIKDETTRFGVESFKIVGARYAMAALGRERLAGGVVCATAGNHGRAVARVAREMGIACTVFMPAPPPGAPEIELRTRGRRIRAIEADGAATVPVAGSYEQAIARAAEHARDTGATVVSDAGWPGYDEIPRLIMLGYTWILEEASRQWTGPPDIVLVQGGVGGLVCAAANWSAARFGASRPFLIACEPDSAACLLESARAGRPVDIAKRPPESGGSGPDDGGRRAEGGRRTADGPSEVTMMAGLRCAVPSPAAWPSIGAGVDAFVSIPDALAVEAMDRLEHPVEDDPALAAGPSGACGVGALLALARAPELAALRDASGLSQSTRVMAVVTEAP